ncbi:MAG: hypothetical protein WD871_01905 [Xanthobacteraceae bacterium]
MSRSVAEANPPKNWKRVDEFDLIEPSGRWRRFRKRTRAQIMENRAFTAVAIVGSAAIWFIVLYGLWGALAQVAARWLP